MPVERLSFEARVVYSTFCLFMLAGFVSSGWLYADDDLGATPAAAARYYLGDPPAEPAAGPALDLPAGAVAAGPLRVAKPPRQVMETFHFHLFSVSVCLLILGHLFMMCRMPAAAKAGVIAVAGVSTFVHLLAPPLIRFAGPGWAVLMFPSATLMGLSWLALTVVPLYQMWRPAVRVERADA